MIEKTADRYNWRLPLYGVLGAVIVLFPIMIFGNGLGAVLIMLVAAAIVSLILLIVAIRKMRHQTLSVLAMLALYCAVSWLLFRVSHDVHTSGRWFVHSKIYKTQVLAQPASANGELKHVVWEWWGFAGSNTVDYLVFDPNDSLASAAKSHSTGKFSGLPCEVFRVRRLESHWYCVLFYTNSAWDHCD